MKSFGQASWTSLIRAATILLSAELRSPKGTRDRRTRIRPRRGEGVVSGQPIAEVIGKTMWTALSSLGFSGEPPTGKGTGPFASESSARKIDKTRPLGGSPSQTRRPTEVVVVLPGTVPRRVVGGLHGDVAHGDERGEKLEARSSVRFVRRLSALTLPSFSRTGLFLLRGA